MPSRDPFEAVRNADLTGLSRVLGQGVDVNSRDEHGNTPLLVGCDQGQLAVVDWLLDHGADIEATRPDGETGLMLAAESDAVDALELLAGRGADIHRTDAHGCTALILAAEYSAWGAVRALLSFGADANAATHADGTANAGRTALMWAASRGSVDGVDLLLGSGAQIHAQDSQHLNAMHHAASEDNNADVVQRLASVGAHVDQVALAGLTPLMCAAKFSNASTVRALLDCGADRNARDGRGQTALDFARQRGANDIVAVLEAGGAHAYSSEQR